jgi:hypothetical protein
MAKFLAGFSPTIVKNPSINPQDFIPKPYKSVCLISADFEMAWASRYTKSCTNPLDKAIQDGIKTRRNVPKILDLCDQYGIPITWATVGHLFLESCESIDGPKHADIPRLPYFENEYWKYDQGDWFDFDPCTDYLTDPAWYAPDLIKDILSRTVKHEIGCHTFSHIDCRDGLDEGQVFKAELQKCADIAQEWGLGLNSFVHPGHTIGNLRNLVDFGYKSFRTNYRNVLGVPIYHDVGIWEFEQTAEFALRKQWSIEFQKYRYKKIIDRAIAHNRLCVLWFHPSLEEDCVEEILNSVLKYLYDRRMSIASMTHKEYSNLLEQRNKA